MIKNKIFTRIASLFLVLVMALSLLPTSILAASPKDPDNNGTTGDGGGGGSSASGSSHTTRDYTGLRFSLYWGENYDSFKKGNASEIIQIGNTIDVNLTGYGSYTPVKESHLSIFKRMSNGAKGMQNHGIIASKYNTSTFCYTEKNYTGAGKDVISKIPVLITPSGNNVTKEKLDAFFMGSGYAKDHNNTDFTNTNKIIQMIIHGTTFKIETIDFANGRYTDADGITKTGVYKLFYEPILYFSVSGTDMALTLRDAIAYNNVNSTILNNFGRYMYTMANAVYLEKDELAIGMKGLKNKLPSISDASNSSSKEYYNSTIYPLVKKEIAPDGRMYNSMGVGVVTGGNEDANPPRILKTYDMITGVNPDGTLVLTQAGESIEIVTDNLNFYTEGELVSKGLYSGSGYKLTGDDRAITNIPKINIKEYISTKDFAGIAILNDIVSTPKELDGSSLTWENTVLAKDAKIELKPIATDVKGSNTGLVTGSEVVTQAVVSFGLEGVPVALDEVSQAESLSSVDKKVLFAPRDTSGKTTVLTIEKSQHFEYWDQIQLGKVDVDNGQVVKLEDTDKLTDSSNTTILRYILKPQAQQLDVVEVVDEEKGTSDFIVCDPRPLNQEGNTVNIQKPVVDLPAGVEEPNIVEWVTNPEMPFKDISKGDLPPVITDGKTGETEKPIPDYPDDPIIHNLYVKWKVVIPAPPGPTNLEDHVPQWRLSKFRNSLTKGEFSPQSAHMNLNLTSDNTSHVTSELSPSGTYNFDTINPNGQRTISGYSADNMNMKTILTSPLSFYSAVTANKDFHSKALPQNTTTIAHGKPYVYIQLDGNLNMIKASDTSGLVAAKWVTPDGTVTGLQQHNINTSLLPKGYSGVKTYNKLVDLRYGIYNKDTYDHKIAVYYHYDEYCDSDDCGGHDTCACYLVPETRTPSQATYRTADYKIAVDFDRYLQQNTDAKKLLVSPVVSSNNTKTTLKYQLNNTYKIYPEYGMLFANDNPNDKNQESIKWVVGDQPRLINPIVYQTLEHKVYVTVPTVSGTQATDSRAITNARKIGESGKPVYYKGAAANPSFQILREQKSSKSGMLTVKTYALDFKDSVKSAWGNGDYKSQTQHDDLVEIIDNQKIANATEKLLIDSPAYNSLDYTGAVKSQKTSPYEKVNYAGKTVTIFTHELIVRGGALIGAKVTNTTTGTVSTLSVAEIKAKEPSLYEAVINMNLYNESNDRSKTIFSTFEHQTGDKLTEGKYGTELGLARNGVDGLDSTVSAITEGKGWYSEDTTVLVIKEYVTNYNVPNIAFGDKISMSVKGLEAPINKNEFFSELGKGYTYLKYDLPIKSVYAKVPDTSAYFEYSSFPKDDLGIGDQKTNYLVPNAVAADALRQN